jgi:hypothetical protein
LHPAALEMPQHMRCLFCKQPSDGARSLEHIVPESLGNVRGNERYLLPRGAVCDTCNNYFAREVEGPLLSHPSFRNIRAWYQVPTKKGQFPKLVGTHFGTGIEIGLRVAKAEDQLTFGPYAVAPERDSEREQLVKSLSLNPNETGFGFILGETPPPTLMSRFLAKMALEAHWRAFHPDAIDQFIDEPHYDRIRNWARRGDNYKEWPFFNRTIFPQETLMRHPDTDVWVQAGFGFRLFLTKRRETFFAFCFYGQEFVINVGGPSVKGYEEWLKDNSNDSPLVEAIGYRLRSRRRGNEKIHYLEPRQHTQQT